MYDVGYCTETGITTQDVILMAHRKYIYTYIYISHPSVKHKQCPL